MEQLNKIADKVNIIAVGEASHGQQLIDIFRVKLFKTLVEKI
jgi:erythromycin esterase-like protein